MEPHSVIVPAGQLARSEKRLVEAGRLVSEAEARGSSEIESKYRASLVQIRTMQATESITVRGL